MASKRNVIPALYLRPIFLWRRYLYLTFEGVYQHFANQKLGKLHTEPPLVTPGYDTVYFGAATKEGDYLENTQRYCRVKQCSIHRNVAYANVLCDGLTSQFSLQKGGRAFRASFGRN